MDKIKSFIESDRGKDILTVIIVILVGLSSFGLGRLSKGNISSGLKVEYPEQINSQTLNQEASAISSITETKTNTGNYFGSNRGSKYYPIGCSAGKSIVQENRVYFNTQEDAESAGYTLSSSCK